MLKTSLALIMLGLSCYVSAVGIPVIDPGKPIKISESAFYSCDQAGNALDNGRLMRYKNKSVICRNDNLWADGKVLSFIDVAADFLRNAEVQFSESM